MRPSRRGTSFCCIVLSRVFEEVPWVFTPLVCFVCKSSSKCFLEVFRDGTHDAHLVFYSSNFGPFCFVLVFESCQ